VKTVGDGLIVSIDHNTQAIHINDECESKRYFVGWSAVASSSRMVKRLRITMKGDPKSLLSNEQFHEAYLGTSLKQ